MCNFFDHVFFKNIITILKMKKEFENIVEKYINAFLQKQEMYSGDWIGFDNIGTIYAVSDMALSFEDIRFDVDNNIKKGKIIDWYWETIDNETRINYKNWLKLEEYNNENNS